MTQDVKAYYDQLAPTYDQNRFGNTYGQYIHEQEASFLRRHLNDNNTLNLGCGTGRFMELASHGLDISEAMIAEAQQKFPGKSFVVSDADDMPFENHTLHQVFCLHVFMHLTTEKAAALIAESGRVLVPGGHFIFDFPSEKRRRLLNKKQEGWHGASAYTLESLKRMTHQHWNLTTSSGILFLPIHRLPKWSRRLFLGLDRLLCRSFLKEYASYLIVKLEKK